MSWAVQHLRSFNRFYTRHLKLLTDRYLGQERPLGEARLLFEIGEHGAHVRDLRLRLGLDSGYLSRLLRNLEREGLVEVLTNPQDRRVRTVELTGRGRAELAETNRRADADAAQLLDQLSESEQLELLGALTTVERLLRRSLQDSAQLQRRGGNVSDRLGPPTGSRRDDRPLGAPRRPSPTSAGSSPGHVIAG